MPNKEKTSLIPGKHGWDEEEKNTFGRFEVAVLNASIVPNQMEVVIGTRWFELSLLLFQREVEEFLWDSKRRELKSRLLKSMMIYILLEIMEYLTDSNRLKRFLLTSLESLDKKREEGILSPQEQEHKYCLSAELTKLLQKIRSFSEAEIKKFLQIEYQSWWKKEQLS
ncbi:hypothetical protein ACJX0J_028867, partial [Zea mays]